MWYKMVLIIARYINSLNIFFGNNMNIIPLLRIPSDICTHYGLTLSNTNINTIMFNVIAIMNAFCVIRHSISVLV